MTRITLHALTAIVAVLASLGAQAQFGFGEKAAQKPVQMNAQKDARTAAKLESLTDRLDALHVKGCSNRQEIVREMNERGDILRRFLLDASAARQRSAQLEAASNPEQSNVDFQASTDFQHMASEVKTLPIPTC